MKLSHIRIAVGLLIVGASNVAFGQSTGNEWNVVIEAYLKRFEDRVAVAKADDSIEVLRQAIFTLESLEQLSNKDFGDTSRLPASEAKPFLDFRAQIVQVFDRVRGNPRLVALLDRWYAQAQDNTPRRNRDSFQFDQSGVTVSEKMNEYRVEFGDLTQAQMAEAFGVYYFNAVYALTVWTSHWDENLKAPMALVDEQIQEGGEFHDLYVQEQRRAAWAMADAWVARQWALDFADPMFLQKPYDIVRAWSAKLNMRWCQAVDAHCYGNDPEHLNLPPLGVAQQMCNRTYTAHVFDRPYIQSTSGLSQPQKSLDWKWPMLCREETFTWIGDPIANRAFSAESVAARIEVLASSYWDLDSELINERKRK